MYISKFCSILFSKNSNFKFRFKILMTKNINISFSRESIMKGYNMNNRIVRQTVIWLGRLFNDYLDIYRTCEILSKLEFQVADAPERGWTTLADPCNMTLKLCIITDYIATRWNDDKSSLKNNFSHKSDSRIFTVHLSNN